MTLPDQQDNDRQSIVKISITQSTAAFTIQMVIYDLVCSRLMSESNKNTAMSAAILWLTVCACDVTNKVGMLALVSFLLLAIRLLLFPF